MALYAARLNRPAPILLPKLGTLDSCSTTKSLVSTSDTILCNPSGISGVDGIILAPSDKLSARALRRDVPSNLDPSTSPNSLAVANIFSSSLDKLKSSS